MNKEEDKKITIHGKCYPSHPPKNQAKAGVKVFPHTALATLQTMPWKIVFRKFRFSFSTAGKKGKTQQVLQQVSLPLKVLSPSNNSTCWAIVVAVVSGRRRHSIIIVIVNVAQGHIQVFEDLCEVFVH